MKSRAFPGTFNQAVKAPFLAQVSILCSHYSLTHYLHLEMFRHSTQTVNGLEINFSEQRTAGPPALKIWWPGSDSDGRSSTCQIENVEHNVNNDQV